jgi:hemerythrin-like domain-containing protein
VGGGTVVVMTTTNSVPQPPFAVTPRRPGEPEVDLMGVTLIHRALRSGARMLADATTGIASGAPCSRERQRAIVQVSLAVLHEISRHHEREDDVLWPVIVASAGDGDGVDLDPLSDDHTVLHTVLQRAAEALPQFARDAVTGAPLLAPVLTELADLLDEHIAEEEAELFPVIREHVSAADFAHCERLFQKGTSPGHMLFVLPWIVEQCDDAELADLRTTAPAPLKLLLRLGQSRYTRRVDLVRGA